MVDTVPELSFAFPGLAPSAEVTGAATRALSVNKPAMDLVNFGECAKQEETFTPSLT